MRDLYGLTIYEIDLIGREYDGGIWKQSWLENRIKKIGRKKMDMIEKRNKYFSLEGDRQATANVVNINKEKFLSLYGDGAFELFPSDKSPSKFYERTQNVTELMEWRLETVMKLLPKDQSLKVINVGGGWEGLLESRCLKERPMLRFTTVDIIEPAKYVGPASVDYIQSNALELKGKIF